MKFKYNRVTQWPPLAWLAEHAVASDTFNVHHGAKVETREQWFCEAAWDGEFSAGDFDRTDIIAGSGVRLREDGVYFVASGSNLDRLHVLRSADKMLISNSLCCLLAWVDGNPDLKHLDYIGDFAEYSNTVLGKHTLMFPSSVGDIQLTYFTNLVWRDKKLEEVAKPNADRHFSDFAEYFEFLDHTMHSVANNARDVTRAFRYKVVCAVSTGYDSTTIAALASKLGEVESFTIAADRHGQDDNGEPIAKVLGIPCRVVARDSWQQIPLAEVPFIAGSGSIGDLAFRSAQEVLSGSVVFTGPCGDTVWGKHTAATETAFGGGIMLGFAEYRLWAGFINIPVPYWAARQIAEIIRISNLPEMAPWDVGGDYTRPICRRIVESAGVPRQLFGQSKKGASVAPQARSRYLSRASADDLCRWLDEPAQRTTAGMPVPALARLLDKGANMASKLLQLSGRVARKLGLASLVKVIESLQQKLVEPYYHHRYIVHWAIDRAKQRYQQATPPN